jgi:hypothetical protein
MSVIPAEFSVVSQLESRRRFRWTGSFFRAARHFGGLRY